MWSRISSAINIVSFQYASHFLLQPHLGRERWHSTCTRICRMLLFPHTQYGAPHSFFPTEVRVCRTSVNIITCFYQSTHYLNGLTDLKSFYWQVSKIFSYSQKVTRKFLSWWLNCKAPLESLLEQYSLVLDMTNRKRQLWKSVMQTVRNPGLEVGFAAPSHDVMASGKTFYLS